MAFFFSLTLVYYTFSLSFSLNAGELQGKRKLYSFALLEFLLLFLLITLLGLDRYSVVIYGKSLVDVFSFSEVKIVFKFSHMKMFKCIPALIIHQYMASSLFLTPHSSSPCIRSL
jgi:hypothetical protein